MSVNTLNFEQSAAILTALTQQATGQAALAPVNEADFVSMAQTTLRTGYDTLGTALSVVLSSSIFSSRVYNAQFDGMRYDQTRWGAITRKINFLDVDIREDDRFKLVDGQSVDPFVFRKVKVVQTNFYGGDVWCVDYSILRDQWDQAMTGSAMFGTFVAGIIQNIMNQIEQIRENERRMALQTLIAGTINRGGAIHLLTEYKDQTGNSTISATNWQSEAEFPYFVKWLYGFINTLVDMMGERNALYHQNIATYNGTAVKPIMRHTPRNFMKGYILNSLMKQIDSSVMSSVFHNEILQTIDFETVNYWQSIQSPSSINVTPPVMSNTGEFSVAESAVSNDAVVGVLFDEEAAGSGTFNEWSDGIWNPRGGYTTFYYHFTTRNFVDYTENAIVLLMDEE